MTTNPAAAMRLMITYAICIPLAIFIGYLLTNPLDYGTLGFFAFVFAMLLAPIFIKWHYPMLVFGLGFPAYLFFLKGDPPFWQIAVMLSLGFAIVERTMNSQRRFLQAPAMTWALGFTVVMAIFTMQLTGGFGLHTLGTAVGGGKKYLNLFLGIAIFFALTSRGIPPAQRKLYIGLFFLSAAFAFISDLFPYLPEPLNYINLLFPPSGNYMNPDISLGEKRLGSLSNSATAIMTFMLARHGLRGILSAMHPVRAGLFFLLFVLSMTGGFRSALIANVGLLAFLFFIEGLHRTRWLASVLVSLLIVGCLVVPFSRDLPFTFQRSLAFLPVDIDPAIRAETQASNDWRIRIWQAMLPKVPDYLLIGKGYSISTLDFESIGEQNIFAASAQMDASLEGLAISSDFHSGPLSTIICFGLWGIISILAIILASLHILYRNYKYGDPQLRTINTLLLAINLEHILHFLFVFGGYDGDVAYFARIVGFSVALNWGVCGPKPRVSVVQRIKPLPQPLPA